MSFDNLMAQAEIMFRGRIFNWQPAEARRELREKVICQISKRYLKRYLHAADEVPIDVGGPAAPVEDRMFSLWLQGEEQAPPLVKACFRTMRSRLAQPVEVLDEKTLANWIELPGFVMDKWRGGKIKPAHFSDLVRVELMHSHGGMWLDATGFVTAPIPQRIVDEPFFVYLAGGIRRHTFMQNAFIRSHRGNALLEMWRAMMLEYWRREPQAFTYFQHQLMFALLVESNPRARALFKAMPHEAQDPTHAVWWGYGRKPFDPEVWARVTADSWFQKTAAKSGWAVNPPAGSVAEEMITRL